MRMGMEKGDDSGSAIPVARGDVCVCKESWTALYISCFLGLRLSFLVDFFMYERYLMYSLLMFSHTALGTPDTQSR